MLTLNITLITKQSFQIRIQQKKKEFLAIEQLLWVFFYWVHYIPYKQERQKSQLPMELVTNRFTFIGPGNEHGDDSIRLSMSLLKKN